MVDQTISLIRERESFGRPLLGPEKGGLGTACHQRASVGSQSWRENGAGQKIVDDPVVPLRSLCQLFCRLLDITAELCAGQPGLLQQAVDLLALGRVHGQPKPADSQLVHQPAYFRGILQSDGGPPGHCGEEHGVVTHAKNNVTARKERHRLLRVSRGLGHYNSFLVTETGSDRRGDVAIVVLFFIVESLERNHHRAPLVTSNESLDSRRHLGDPGVRIYAHTPGSERHTHLWAFAGLIGPRPSRLPARRRRATKGELEYRIRSHPQVARVDPELGHERGRDLVAHRRGPGKIEDGLCGFPRLGARERLHPHRVEQKRLPLEGRNDGGTGEEGQPPVVAREEGFPCIPPVVEE